MSSSGCRALAVEPQRAVEPQPAAPGCRALATLLPGRLRAKAVELRSLGCAQGGLLSLGPTHLDRERASLAFALDLSLDRACRVGQQPHTSNLNIPNF